MNSDIDAVSSAVAIILLLVGVYGLFQGLKSPRFDIERIEILQEQLPYQVKAIIQEQKSVAKNDKPTVSKKKVSQEYDEFQQECFDALKGLGTSAKESKFIVNTVFNKHTPKDLQEFINLAFIRGK